MEIGGRILSDFEIDLKEVEHLYGIKITNPLYAKSRLTFKEKLIKSLNIEYRKHRTFLKKIFHESVSEKYMLNGYNSNSLDSYFGKKDYNAPHNPQKIEPKGSDGETKYFYLEYINVYEVFEKENIEYLRTGLEKFSKHHAQESRIGKDYKEDSFENVNYFNNLEFDILVATFAIKEESSLKKYIDGFEIRMSGLTATLAVLTIKMHVSQEMKELLNEIAVQNAEDYKFCDVHNKVKSLRQFRIVGCATIPGYRYKNQLKCVIEAEIKWKVIQELGRYIDMPTLNDQEYGQALLVYRTNIDGNSYPVFWQSIGVDRHGCDFLKGYSACINWMAEFTSDLYYIYDALPGKNADHYPEIMSWEIERVYREYKASRAILNKTRQLLSMNTCEASFLAKNKGKIQDWLRIKKELENELILSNRFIKEFDLELDDEDMFFVTNRRKDSITQSQFVYLKEDIKECKDTLESVMGIVDANLEALASASNYQLQHRTMIINGLSAVFALIAIMLTLVTMKKQVDFIHVLNRTLVEQMGSYILIVMLVIGTVYFLLLLSRGIISGVSRVIRYFRMKKHCKR